MIASEFLRDKIRETSGTMSVRLFQISVFTMDSIGPTLNAMALSLSHVCTDKKRIFA